MKPKLDKDELAKSASTILSIKSIIWCQSFFQKSKSFWGNSH